MPKVPRQAAISPGSGGRTGGDRRAADISACPASTRSASSCCPAPNRGALVLIADLTGHGLVRRRGHARPGLRHPRAVSSGTEPRLVVTSEIVRGGGRRQRRRPPGRPITVVGRPSPPAARRSAPGGRERPRPAGSHSHAAGLRHGVTGERPDRSGGWDLTSAEVAPLGNCDGASCLLTGRGQASGGGNSGGYSNGRAGVRTWMPAPVRRRPWRGRPRRPPALAGDLLGAAATIGKCRSIAPQCAEVRHADRLKDDADRSAM